LIVEDNPANMKLATFVLQSAGHTVVSATDAETGMARAHDAAPRLISWTSSFRDRRPHGHDAPQAGRRDP